MCVSQSFGQHEGSGDHINLFRREGMLRLLYCSWVKIEYPQKKCSIKEENALESSWFIKMMHYLLRVFDSTSVLKLNHHTSEEKESPNLQLRGFNHNSVIQRAFTDESNTPPNTD